MAYDFVSPGAAAAAAIEELLVRRQAEARQRMLDEITRKNTESQIADRETNRKLQAVTTDALADQRAQAARKAQTDEFLARVETIAPDSPVDPSIINQGRELGMGHLFQAPEPTYAGMSGDDASDPVMEQGPGTFRGLPEQIKTREDRKRAEDYLATLSPDSNEARALRYQLSTGSNAPAGMFEKQPQSSDITEYEYYVKQATGAGQSPISFLEWQKQQANLKQTGANGQAPYYIPVTTGTGIKPFNARTGQFLEDGRQDLRPSATAEGELTKAQATLYQLDQIGRLFTPERVGPLKGRYNTMQLAVAGEMGDQGLAELQSSLSTLKNTVINLRTGAQMSEPEAQRILQEVPDFNLPPDVFMARLNHAQDYFRDYLSRRAKLAFGRTSSGDVDQMLQGNIAPAPSHTPTGTTTTTPATAPPARRKFNPATGKLE